MNRKLYLYAISVALGVAPGAVAQRDTFTTIDYPGAAASWATGINDAGDIVGKFIDSNNLSHGYLLSGGKFTEINFPGARQTWVCGINSRGDIAGFYHDGTKQRGFVLSQGKFTTVDCGDGTTWLYGINSAGDAAGWFWRRGQPASLGLLWSNGVCTLVEHQPEARKYMTMLFGINDAEVMVGHWAPITGYSAGLVYTKGVFTQTDQGGGGVVVNCGINNAGEIVGWLRDANGARHGFLLRNGRFTLFDPPGSPDTYGTGINNSGQIAGYYIDSANKWHGFVARVTPAGLPPPTLTVDDDGAECPGALRTIQEAVAEASPGSTILVCAGTYRRTVNIAGPEKNGLKLIAAGNQGEVVLQGDYTQRDGFHLENVTNVLIRGFTVRDFGTTSTTATDWGVGNQIYLENAHYNTIEQNSLVNGDMMGIMLRDSGNNLVQNNFAWVTIAALANCGIHVTGAKSANNTIRLNIAWGNKFAGIMIRGAGPGNRVQDNTVLANGRFGIDVQNTDEIWIEGNRVSYNRGFWGAATPGGKEPGLGINLVNVNKATVFDNRLRSNSGGDLSWDRKGENKLEANACETSSPAGACAR